MTAARLMPFNGHGCLNLERGRTQTDVLTLGVALLHLARNFRGFAGYSAFLGRLSAPFLEKQRLTSVPLEEAGHLGI